jgi:protein SCO1/2
VRDTSRADDQRLAGNRWGAQYFPNVELTTHDGRSVRFFDDMIEGRVVVLNFIYTACPDACPMETARLAEVQEILGDRIGEDVFMYSITIDPDRDTPEVLAEYRSRFGARDGWTFLTGDEEDILLLRRKLGLYIEEEGKAETDHNLNMLIGNQATGHWALAEALTLREPLRPGDPDRQLAVGLPARRVGHERLRGRS